jgi:cytochrome c oxidase cbb3-type subunit 3
MYKNVLESIDNIAIWPVVSFVIFFLFFICLLWYVFSIKNDFIHQMKNLPLDDGQKPARESSVKMLLIPVLILLTPFGALAQTAAPAPKTFWEDPTHHPLFGVYLIMSFVIVIIVLISMVAMMTYKALSIIKQKTEEEKAKRLGIPYVPSVSIWEKFWEDANAMLPMEQEKEIVLDHNYDGIRELDNHLPPWWKGLFYACIVFAVVYMFAYHFSGYLPSTADEYKLELAAADEQARIYRASQPAEVIDVNTLAFTKDAAFIDKGKQLFASNNCQSCHRIDGGGNSIGPNLTDEYWLHGGHIKDVFTTINHGVIEKAMPAWGKVMSQKDVRDLAFYVMSLQGSNPADGKKSQGEFYKQVEEAAPVVPADTTATSMKK